MMYAFGLRPEYRFLVAILVSSTLVVPVVLAEQGTHTTITSQTMTIQGKSGRTVFEGMVAFERGDFVMRSDQMIVTFRKGGQPGSRGNGPASQVDRIEASGKVLIEKSDGKATCGRAFYYKDEEKLVLTESPVAWQGGTRIEGSRMTMFLKEERSIVEGGSHVVIREE